MGEVLQKSIDAEFDSIAENNSKDMPVALGRKVIEIVPFGIDLTLPFTEEHDKRAQDQMGEITITSYSSTGDPIDR